MMPLNPISTSFVTPSHLGGSEVPNVTAETDPNINAHPIRPVGLESSSFIGDKWASAVSNGAAAHSAQKSVAGCCASR